MVDQVEVVLVGKHQLLEEVVILLLLVHHKEIMVEVILEEQIILAVQVEVQEQLELTQLLVLYLQQIR